MQLQLDPSVVAFESAFEARNCDVILPRANGFPLNTKLNSHRFYASASSVLSCSGSVMPYRHRFAECSILNLKFVAQKPYFKSENVVY